MRTETGKPVRLEDYAPPDWLVDKVDLDFVVAPDADQGARPAAIAAESEKSSCATDAGWRRVDAALPQARRNAARCRPLHRLRLSSSLLPQPPQGPCTLEIETLVDPTANTQLSGLYRSSGNYCTQCEAEGFRRITYFPDRPDVMAVYTTRIEADKAEAPVLLANGNLIESGDACRRPAFCRLARSVSQTVLSVCAGRRQSRLCRGSFRDDERAGRRAQDLCRARQGGPLRLRNGCAEAINALGRSRHSAANMISTSS